MSECKQCSTAIPFYSVLASGHGHQPFGVFSRGRRVHPRITHSLLLAKNGSPFHLSALPQVLHYHRVGVQQSGGRVHQGITRHGGLAKDSPFNLIRQDKPVSGSVPSNAILRFEKSSNAYHASQTKDITYALGGSFIGIFNGSFGLVFPDCPGQGGGFVFQTACDLLASIGPGVGQRLSSLDI